ncbi:hypothetical protein [Herpetosiphon geysericola]|uniref:DUF1330 domain-containing protein n=1 Tax=Herpetosiphon geysericola TaxID=70996 RepID=A0A0P6YAR1_9CHLR|nr:hypothetical protein [Herpetosiphon geysericola]KPL90372.1 hypothetical protein SE18_07115 [Herpetosiphon geysericola]
MSIYLTQLIYLHPGQSAAFEQFEALVLPLLAQYHGHLLLRIRPTPETVIEQHIEQPDEIQPLEFASSADFERYLADPQRQQFLYLKAQSIRSSLVIHGPKL